MCSVSARLATGLFASANVLTDLTAARTRWRVSTTPSTAIFASLRPTTLRGIFATATAPGALRLALTPTVRVPRHAAADGAISAVTRAKPSGPATAPSIPVLSPGRLYIDVPWRLPLRETRRQARRGYSGPTVTDC